MKKIRIIAILLATLCLLTGCDLPFFEKTSPPPQTDDKTSESPHATEELFVPDASEITESSEATAPTETPEMDRYVEMLALHDHRSFFYEKGSNADFVYLTYYHSSKDMYFVIIKEYIGSSASVTIPDSLDGNPVVGFYHSIFEQCDFVEDISFPDTLRTVIFNTNADTDTCMTNTQWYQNQPDGIYYAGKIAIGYKGSMPENTTITFREGTLGIGGGAFRLQKNLVGIEIPPSMLMISDDAFGGCGLVEVTIPRTLQYYAGAFGSCHKLVRVTFEEGIEEIRGTFSGDNLSEVVLPSTLITIGEDAFHGCESLTSITLPANTLHIKDHAFYQSGLTHIELNDGLVFIGKEAFQGCRDLKSVYIPASATDIGLRAFGFIWDDTLVPDFVAYFEENCSYMDYLKANGIQCTIGTRSSAHSGS